MRLERLIKILILLANNKNITVRGLSEKFGVSRKTIYQDLDTIILSGVPIVYGQNNKGIIKIMEGFNFPKFFVNSIVESKYNVVDDNYIKYKDYDNNMKNTFLLWKCFIQRRQIEMSELNPTILHSWIRCQRHNIPIYEIDSNNLLSPEQLNSYSIETIMCENVRRAKLFSTVLEHIGWFGMIYNNKGILVHIINPFSNYNCLYPHMGYFLDVNEERIGTNAVSLSLYENRTIMVRGTEHYNKNLHNITSISSPIYKDGQRYGVLNIRFIHTSVNPQIVYIVNSFARLYESLVLNEHLVNKMIESKLYDNEIVSSSIKIPELYGESLHWQRIISIVNHFSVIQQHVTIIGEEGVGKQSIAKLIHAKSTRKYAPCCILNSENKNIKFWREEIFGVETKQKETYGLFEKAEGGVLIIRYPHKLPKYIQKSIALYLKTSKIRRVGGRKAITFNTRVIITLPDLKPKGLIDELRNQLILTVYIQPLRQRKEDIRAIYKGLCNRNNIKKDKIQIVRELSFLEDKILDTNVKALIKYYKINN